MEVAEFVAKFHSVDGKSIGEKRKHLFLLLHKAPSDHNTLIASITPKNHLEHLFKLEILLTLQKVPELIQMLKSEEEYISAKLLKSKWFCKTLSAILDEDSSGFVSNIMPFTSFVIRKRLLNKLAIYGTQLDGLYDETCAQYGVYVASNLLVGCTAEKIKNILEHHRIILSPSHLKLLYQKHPQLFAKYAQRENLCESVMNYIARQDSQAFLKFVQEFNLKANLGKRLTKKLLMNFKDLLITNAIKFSYSLHLKTVIKELGSKEFKRFYFNCFPSSIDSLRYSGPLGFIKISTKLGKDYYKFLLEGVEKVYNKSLYNFPDLVNEDMMESMGLDEREKWIAIKRKNGTSEADLIKYMKIADSIPLLKNKINVTSSVSGRAELINVLLKTSKINDDFNALAEIGEYVCSRHRNDTESLLSFLYELNKLFQLEKLEERHWKSINSVINILNMKPNNFYFKYDFALKHVEFLFHKNKLTEAQIQGFLNIIKSIGRWDYTTCSEELQNILLLKSISLMPKLMEKDDKLEFYDLILVNAIFEWNKKHTEDRISIADHPRLIESLRKSIEFAINGDDYISELHRLSPIFQNIICTKENSSFRDEIIKNYFLVNFRYYNLDIDLWLIKFQPEIISVNFNKFLEHVLNSYQPDLEVLNYVKKYTEFSFGERTVSHCLEKIAKNEKEDKLFVILAVLMPANNFLQVVSPFEPSNNKIDESDDESIKKGNVAIAITKSFKYSTSVSVLPSLVKYCKGDFLRYSLESLYYRFYHSPENKLSVFINDLSSKSVSVRKHSIFLTCIVGNVGDVQKLLQRFIENERNVSVQKHLFTAALKYFIRNPSDEFWECVKVCMTNLDKNDRESFTTLVNIQQIPAKYQASHVMFVWEILTKTEDFEKNRPRLLSSIPRNVFTDFPFNFLLEVILSNFLKIESSCDDFVIAALTQTNYKTEIIDEIFRMITKLKSAKYNSLQEEKSGREIIYSFVANLVTSFGTEEQNHEILRIFSEGWHAIFTITEAMREHLKLSFTLLYLDSKKNLLKFSTATAEFLENLVTIYGVVIVDTFASELMESLKMFLCCYSEMNEDFFIFCLNLLKNWNNLTFYLLVIKLLPTTIPSEDKTKILFHEIIQNLRQVPQDSIQMLMNLYIMGLE